MKRNGARLFKNPPQPHMCIQDYIQGTSTPCYVNVLSWGKIGMPLDPSQPVPLYGGMRVSPPRTMENTEAIVFAVMANPEVLRLNGKNARDPKERSTLIELLLDFVEAMNEGTIFSRRYTILKDRDITGELKEVWSAVQAKRDKEQSQQAQQEQVRQETWIDVQPPSTPRHPRYQEPPRAPSHQEYTNQPPRYHSRITYGRVESGQSTGYDGYVQQALNPTLQNEQMFQPRQPMAQQYHGNISQVAQDRYNYRERGGRQQIGAPNPAAVQQAGCPAYPAPQYFFQQLPRPNLTGHYVALQQQMIGQRQLEKAMRSYIGQMQHQQQQQQPSPPSLAQPQQTHVNHIQPGPVIPQYESSLSFNVQPSQPTPVNVVRLGRPHMGVAQKSNVVGKRQANSPTHSKQASSADYPETSTKSKSPVKVLQREPLNPTQLLSADKDGETVEGGGETSVVRVTDLDEVQIGGKDLASVESVERDIDESSDLRGDGNERIDVEDTSTRCPRETKEENSIEYPAGDNDSSRTKIVVLKRNKSGSESKWTTKEPKVVKNGKKPGEQTVDLVEDERQPKKTEPNSENRPSDRAIDLAEVEAKKVTGCEGRNGLSNKRKPESPKRPQTVNSIIKSVLKIHPGGGGSGGTGSSVDGTSKRKSAQAKANTKATSEHEDSYQGYTILRKAVETSREDVASEISQISIQACKDTTEVGAVLS
ncbi:uncharacterized protein LOC105697326 [Orussus abietinus]|uniref:uncharacterized protein LOC105697326 n=1 Tax=Orussus abietinus TaxID=222816 RepID=UPI0006252D5A|nr:uncharacterized protein LOC105697326 [Orussus abietinus]XP_012275974.1 uncharacterized protein LOC105697326 [Orussus abietinus]